MQTRFQSRRWLVLFTFLILPALIASVLLACGIENSPSMNHAIQGLDDRRTVQSRAPVYNMIGSISLDDEPVCTAFAVSPTTIMTAFHCVDSSLEGQYAFSSSLGIFDVSYIEETYDNLDIVELRIEHQMKPDVYRIDGMSPEEIRERDASYLQKRQRPVFSSYFELADHKPKLEALTEVISFDKNSGTLLENAGTDVLTEFTPGFIFHALDTVPGASGSPILQDGEVIAVHIGSAGEYGNLATLTSTLFDIDPSVYNIHEHVHFPECSDGSSGGSSGGGNSGSSGGGGSGSGERDRDPIRPGGSSGGSSSGSSGSSGSTGGGSSGGSGSSGGGGGDVTGGSGGGGEVEFDPIVIEVDVEWLGACINGARALGAKYGPSFIRWLKGLVPGGVPKGVKEAAKKAGLVNREAISDLASTTKSLSKSGKLPNNFITKEQAKALGWDPRKGNLDTVAPGKRLGGDIFRNRRGQQGLGPNQGGLPTSTTYREADLGYRGGFRGKSRLVYGQDGSQWLSTNHFQTFTRIK